MLNPIRITLALCLAIPSLVKANSQSIPPLPTATTNNAVASVIIDEQQYLLSFMGLNQGKTYQDVHNKAWKLNLSQTPMQWQQISPVPAKTKLKGRLASVAVGIEENVYLFGGYTIASNKEENSTPDAFQYHVPTDTYTRLAPMPVPVDDAVALVYRQRYIYIVSGWHNDGNVNLVQVYDTVKAEWFQASPFVGQPVFGHAGGIVDNQIMICDGVTTMPSMHKRRSFAQQTACYRGEINPTQPDKINWYTWFHPTDAGRYRMAAAGDIDNDRILFVGGSYNPYNFNGVGYNGQASEPTSEIWSYHVDKRTWEVLNSEQATMDHRGLLNVSGKWFTVGGMGQGQKVLAEVTAHNASQQETPKTVQ